MSPPPVPEQLSRTIETLYRSESGRVLATLVRLLGDLDLAEESMHEAFAAALESWTLAGIPEKPRPWLISTARFKAIDAMRRRARFDGAERDLVAHMESRVNRAPGGNEEIGDEEGRDGDIEDDRLRLIFTCCHPALPPEATGSAHSARNLRPDNGGDCPGISGTAGNARPTHCARQGKDSGDADSLRGAGAARVAGAAGRGASGHLSRL